MSQAGELNSPPPLPPPPPLPDHLDFNASFQKPKISPKTLNAGELSSINENELNLAIKKLISISINCSRVFYRTNTCLLPQLQDGPKCGLVALSIASSATEHFVNVEDIFQTALSLGLTKQGEMFSSESLALLAEKCCGFKTRTIKGLIHHFHCIVSSLLRKCLLLVPYDADFNHSPCCKKGSKAHWAVISGLLITEERPTPPNAEDEDFLMLNGWNGSFFCSCIDGIDKADRPLTISIHEEKIIIGKTSPKKIHRSFGEGKIYLIGLQGKSRHVGLWPFHEMAASNDNLVLFSATRDSDRYVLPEGGLEEGLKGKAIILDYS